MVREYVGLAPDDGDAVGLRAERALEAKVLLVGAAKLAQEVPQRRLAVPETLKLIWFEAGVGGQKCIKRQPSLHFLCPA